MTVNTNQRNPGIRIVASAAKLPPEKKPLVKAFEKATFRHPLFATGLWVVQPGRPYFNETAREGQPSLTTKVNHALETAAQEMAQGVR